MGPKKKVKPEEIKVPDIWQWLSDDKVWTTFSAPDAAIIEKAYQEKVPTVTTDKMSFSTGNKVTFDLKNKVQKNEDTATERPIRRLTKATWEWKDDHDLFCAYYDEDAAMIEMSWRSLDGGQGAFSTTKLSFNEGFDSKYTFTLKQTVKGDVSGIQKNEDSGTERIIRRVQQDPGAEVWDTKTYGIAAMKAPEVPVATPSADSGVVAVVEDVFAPPPTWQPQTSPLQYFPVKEGSDEWKEATGSFLKTLGCKVTIHSVKRIQNEVLWKFYALTRHKVALRNNKKPNEMILFHGARVKENMNAIENFGFDMRVARDGSAGIGIYFAVNSSYSNGGYVLRHPDNSREMYVCRTAVGSHFQGKHGMKRPPPKTGKKAEKDDLYDSVHNGKPISMYIVFDNNQAYPEYLIHYTPSTKGWW